MKRSESAHFSNLEQKFSLAVDLLGAVTNVLSCLILGLVVFLIVRISLKVRVGRQVMATKRQVNALVTASHVIVALAYTTT